MSQHRGRNIFTLGDFHLKTQRSSSASRNRACARDPFERDPFKIQSYNFRYAERPIYPVRPTQWQQEQPQNKLFNTFYYNQDFSPVSNNTREASGFNTFGNNASHPQGSTSKYQEYRRKKFVQNSSIPGAQQNSVSGTLNPYPKSLNSSRNYQFQGNRQPTPRNSFADNFLDTNKSQTVAPSLGRECQRNILSSNSELSKSSLLRRSVTNSYLEFANRNTQAATSFADAYNGVKSSDGNVSRSGGNLMTSLSGNSNTRYIGNANQNFSLASMRANISHSSFMELPKRQAQHRTNSRIKSENPIFTPPLNHFPSPLPPDTRTHQSLHSTSRSPCSKRIRSSSSGCEININIKNLKDNAVSENVTIKIERDPMEENLDVPPKKKLNLANNLPTYSITPNVTYNTNTSSSTSFVIDKRLSKYSVGKPGIENSPSNTKRLSSTLCLKNKTFSRLTLDGYNSQTFNNPLEKDLRERTKTLNSIYGPQSQSLATGKSSMPRVVPSSERMPSMVLWRDNLKIPRKFTSENLKSPAASKDHKSKGSLIYSLTNLGRASESCRISNIPQTCTNSNANRVNNFIKSINSKISLKRIILQKFHSSKQLQPRSQPMQLKKGALPSGTEKRGYSKQEKLYCSRIKKLNWSKLPLKININVFAEKVKLLRA